MVNAIVPKNYKEICAKLHVGHKASWNQRSVSQCGGDEVGGGAAGHRLAFFVHSSCPERVFALLGLGKATSSLC